MRALRIWILISMLAACGDSGTTTDTGTSDAAADGGTDAGLDGAPDGGTDSGTDTSTDTGADASDGSTGITITGREVCAALMRCAPSIPIDTCAEGSQATIDEGERLGCTAEGDAANRCTVDAYDRAADAGTCEAVDFASCDDEYATLSACFRAAGAVTDFACDNSEDETRRTCISYVGNINGPEATCDALEATPVSSCPTENVVGRCEIRSFGGTTTTAYYAPLPTGLTIEIAEAACDGLDGTWTAAP